MSIIYVPANKNSFWQQIYNGNGLYGLAMSQLVKGFMNGVNKRHEAYIDKQVQDRQAAQYGQFLQRVLDNRGTTQQTSYNPVGASQYQPQDKLDTIALEPAKYENSLNPNVFNQNRQKAALQNSLNQPMQNFVDNAWNNVEGRGINTQTVPGDFTEEGLLQAAVDTRATPDMVDKVRAILTNRYKNAADLADAQQRVKLLQGMQEPQTVNQIGQSSLIAGKDMTNAYNFVNPQLKLDVRNAGDRSDYTVFNPRTGDMTTTQGQPYGISAEKAMEDTTKREIHYSPSGSTIYTQAHTDKRHADTVNKGLTPNQQIQSVYAGGQLAQMYGDDIEGLDTAISSFAPNIQPYIRMGAGSGKVYDKGKKRYITNPTKAGDISAPQPKPQAQPKAQATWKQPAQLSADEQAWVNYVKSNTDTTGMTTAQILALRKKK